MSDELTIQIARQVARVLAGGLDEDSVSALAARLRPYLEADSGSDRLLTASEAAERANVHVETVRRAIRSGDLSVAGKVGRSLRISVSAIDEWLAAGADPSEQDQKVRQRRVRRPPARGPYSLLDAFGA